MSQEGEASAAWAATSDMQQSFQGYNIRGVLYFLQKNWSNFERDRAKWESEKAELKAYVGFLEGERRGQANLKRDLVRRIKMLEFALKQERAKHLNYVASKESSNPAAAAAAAQANSLLLRSTGGTLSSMDADSSSGNNNSNENNSNNNNNNNNNKGSSNSNSSKQDQKSTSAMLLSLGSGLPPPPSSANLTHSGANNSTNSGSGAGEDEASETVASARFEAKMRPSFLPPSALASSSSSSKSAAKKSRHILRKYLSEIGLTEDLIRSHAESVRVAMEQSALFDAQEDAAVHPQLRTILRSGADGSQSNSSDNKNNNSNGFKSNNNTNDSSSSSNSNSSRNSSRNSSNGKNGTANMEIFVSSNGDDGGDNHYSENESKPGTLANGHMDSSDNAAAQIAHTPVTVVSVNAVPVNAIEIAPSVASEEDALADFDFLSDEQSEEDAASSNTTADTSSKNDATTSTKAEPAATTSAAAANEAEHFEISPRKSKSGRSSVTAIFAAPVPTPTPPINKIDSPSVEEADEEFFTIDAKKATPQLTKVLENYEKGKSSRISPVKRSGGSRKSGGKSSLMGMFSAEGESDKEKKLTEADVLGELADLTVAPESETAAEQKFELDGTTTHQWKPKYTLRGHFDNVRAVVFHDTEPVILSASDDNTIKLWNLKNMPSGSKKSAHSPDLEPTYTYRGHTDAVHCLALSVKDGIFFSGGADTVIRVWKLVPLMQQPYAAHDTTLHIGELKGHTDAIWSLAVHPVHDILLSLGAEKAAYLWNYGNLADLPLVKVDFVEVPTCAAFVFSDLSRFVVGFQNAKMSAYDISTGKCMLEYERPTTSQDDPIATQINQVVSHSTLPILITANEDKTIRFFDAHSGQCTHSMIAHLDSVSSLAIDPSGLFLLSGGHDMSLRLWDIDKKTCLQEISTHRKKFDESVHSVTFHPSLPYIASGGADGSVKVYA